MDWRPLLDLLFPPQCPSCNALGKGLCFACVPTGNPIRVQLPSLRLTARGLYAESLRDAVLALKDGRRDVAESLGEIVAPLLEPGTLLVPVPTTARRRRIRGLDGVELVARIAATITGAQVVKALEQRAGDAQRGRTRRGRLAARGRFTCGPAVGSRRVTLFDDVCTTGATLQDCANAIRAAGGLVEDAVVVALTKSAHPWQNANSG
ncbi:MAG: hypothetical protein WA814_09015 [Candidatus Baltobacteraceae bacterium]